VAGQRKLKGMISVRRFGRTCQGRPWLRLAVLIGVAALVLAPLVATGAGSSVCFEAEKGTLSGQMKAGFTVSGGGVTAKMQKDIKEQASGRNYIGVPEDGNAEKTPIAGSCTIQFTAPAKAKYTVYLRAWWLDSCANSFKLKFDALPELEIGQDTTYKSWHWVKLNRPIELDGGAHTLVIKNTEDGALADQFYLTAGGPVPQGKMAPTK